MMVLSGRLAGDKDFRKIDLLMRLGDCFPHLCRGRNDGVS